MRRNENRDLKGSEFEINLLPLLKELFKKIWLIALVGLITGGVAFLGSKLLIKPTYRSSFTAYVNNKQEKGSTENLTSSDVAASKLLVLTYEKILKSNTILSASAKAIGVERSYENLKSIVSTEVNDDTEIISVYVESTDPTFAYEYAESISKTAPEYMANIVEGSSMKIVDYPVLNNNRYGPSYFRYALIGFSIGALLVIIWLVILFLLDDTVKSEGDIESRFSLPMLGVIPDTSRSWEKDSDYYSYNYYAKEHKSEQKSEQKNESEEKKKK